jgi:aryl-alcohol dehydrogenase-like predicted oxidoreductase
MEYRHLGRSGLIVSALAYGNWITHGGQVEEDAAQACVRKALDLGFSTFDTADIYAMGRAEEVLGRALKGQRRESLEIFTKVYWPTGPGPNDRGLARKHIMESIHASLRRLQTDYVDLYQAHRYDVEAPLEETLRAFDDLVRQGKVLYVGVSEWTAEQIESALQIADDMGFDRLVSNQPEYSLLWRVIEAEVVPFCEREGIGQIVWSPLEERWRLHCRSPHRRSPRAGPGIRRTGTRRRPHACSCGSRLGPREPERIRGNRRRDPTRATRREREGTGRRSRT